MGRSRRPHKSNEGVVNGEWCGGDSLPNLEPVDWEGRKNIKVPTIPGAESSLIDLQSGSIQWVRQNVLVPKGVPKGAEWYFCALLKMLRAQGITVLSSGIQSSVDDTADAHGDLVDQAAHQIDMNHVQHLLHVQNEIQAVQLNRIDTALRLMAVGWDGERCLSSGCRSEIPEVRRLAVPGTMFCARCKAALELQSISAIELRYEGFSHSLQPAAA